MAGLSAQELTRRIDQTPECSVLQLLERMANHTHGGTTTMLIPLHVILEAPEMDVQLHPRVFAATRGDKKARMQITPKKYTKMIVCLDMANTGCVLLFDDAVAANLSTKQFDGLQLGRPFLVVPSRQTNSP